MKIAIIGAACLLAASLLPADAGPVPGIGVKSDAGLASIETVQYRRGGFVARGPRGGVVAGRGVAVGRPYPVRPVPVRPGGAWVRPPAYWWRPGAAVAAGAALGFVTAAAATTYVASRPPAPGYCWYYTNTQRTQGFWDVCP